MSYTMIFVGEKKEHVQFSTPENPELNWRYTTANYGYAEIVKAVNDCDHIAEIKRSMIATKRNETFLRKMVPTLDGKDFIMFILGNTIAICDDPKKFLTTSNERDYSINTDKVYEHLFKKHEIFLIVGIADGLDSELINDIRVTCKKADFERSTDEILKQCNNTGDEKIEIVRRSDHTLLRIVVSPTIEEFETFMKRAILEFCGRLSLTIVYCGHGTEAGSICLFDGDYSGAELRQLLAENFLGNFPTDLNLYLNCCYAINIATEINGENELDKLTNLFSTINDEGKKNSLEIITKAFFGNQEANDKIQKLMKEKLGPKTFFKRQWGQLSLYVFPLSVGVLKAQGLLCEAFLQKASISGSPQDTQLLQFRTKWYETENGKKRLQTLFAPQSPLPILNSPLSQLQNSRSESPKVKVFGAKNGDSALFSWEEWNVLIDGGVSHVEPCFVDSICKLKSLDVVVLTHGDADHINGLLPFFKKISNDKTKHPKAKFVQKAAFLYHDMAQRGWSHANQLYKYAKKAEIECTGIREIHVPSAESHTKIVIRFIHPPPGEQLLKVACEKLSQSRNLINESSLVVCIECMVGQECTHRLLFTGDSDGIDVIEALKKESLLDKEFSYVDMPHHGSKYNDPKEFLEKIKAKNIGVSTNGDRHKHPHIETIVELKEYLKRNASCTLYFNYQHGSRADISTHLAELPEGRVHFNASGFELTF